MKTFDKNLFKQPFFWTSIFGFLAIGILVALYSHAWVAPTASPNSSAGAAINFSGGNVGIGTTGPGAKLHVYNGASGQSGFGAGIVTESNTHQYINLVSAANTQQGIMFGNPTSLSYAGMLWEDGSRGNLLQFKTANTVQVTIDNTGNVGIGTTAPGEKLEVAGNIKMTGTGNGIKFPDGTSQTTAASAVSQFCTFCLSCGGTWPNNMGMFGPCSQNYCSRHSTSCSGGLVVNTGATDQYMYLCCK